MFYPNDSIKICFEIGISIILLLTCFITPLQFAFQEELDALEWFMIMNYTIDFIFLVDIVVQFNSAYQNEVFEMIDDRKMVAKNYLLTWFFIDVLSILPLDLILKYINHESHIDIHSINSDDTSNINEMARFTRVSKLYKLVKITRLFRLFKLMKNKGKII